MGETTTIAELKNIMVKVQVPSVDYTVIEPGLIIGGMSVPSLIKICVDRLSLIHFFFHKVKLCFYIAVHGFVAFTFV